MPARLERFDRAIDRLASSDSAGAAARDLLVVAGVVQLGLAAVALDASLSTQIAGLRAPFGTTAAALLVSGGLTVLRRRGEFVTGVLAALTAAAFALSLAEFTIRDASDTSRYASLWVPCVLAGILGSLRLASSGWRRR